MKSKLKYMYYKICTILLGGSNSGYSGHGYRTKFARLLPGYSSAVLLTIKGKVFGVGYNRWMLSNAHAHKVHCWVRRRNKQTVETLLVGKLKQLDVVVDFVRGSRFTRIDQINERWLVKEKAGGLPAIAKPVGEDRDGDEKFVITFAGDTSLGDYYLKKPGLGKEYERLQRDPISFFKKVLPLTKGSSFFILNLETVLADEPVSPLEGIKKWMGWDSPGRTLSVLKKLGVNAVSLANNHAMDFGPEILKQTRRLLNEAGIQTFGAGDSLKEAAEPIKIQCKGKKSNKNIYVFGAMLVKWEKRFREDYNYYATKNSPGVNIFDPKRICNNIARLRKSEPDALIIVFPHWQGYDYKLIAPEIKDVCNKLIGSGADFVFGQGTHTYGHFDETDEGGIVYSIGNFVFNSPGRYGKLDALPYSVIVKLELSESVTDWCVDYKLYPIFSDNKVSGFTPQLLVETNELNTFLKLVNEDLPMESKIDLKIDTYGFYYITIKTIKNSVAAEDDLKATAQMVKDRISKRKANTYSKNSASLSKLIPNEFRKLGYSVTKVDRYDIVQVDGGKIYLWQSIPIGTSLVSAKMVGNKGVTRKFLEESGISVARGRSFTRKDKEKAKHYALKLSSAVIKPIGGSKGKGVTVGVKDKKEFQDAWVKASKSGKVLIEEQFEGGAEARYFIVGGKCVAVIQRIVPHVIGNGVDTVSRLIEKKNRVRAGNPHLRNKPIKLDKHRLLFLKKQGYGPASVIPNGAVAVIDRKANFSTGADSIDITDKVHISFKKIAERAATAVPELDVAGVDIIALDHTEPSRKDNYIVVEINSRPAIGSHHYPIYGQQRNVAKDIVEYVLKQQVRPRMDK